MDSDQYITEHNDHKSVLHDLQHAVLERHYSRIAEILNRNPELEKLYGEAFRKEHLDELADTLTDALTDEIMAKKKGA